MLYKDDQAWPEGITVLLGKNFKLKKDAVFELVKQNYGGVKQIGEKGNKTAFSFNQETGFEPIISWTDPVTQNTSVIRYAERKTPVTTNKQGHAITGSYHPFDISFVGGILTVPKEKLDLYAIILCQRGCIDNPLYVKNPDLLSTITPKIRLINKEAEIEKAYEKKMKIAEAYQKIKDAGAKVLREVYASYDKRDSATASKEGMTVFLLGQAEADPIGFIERWNGEDKVYLAMINDAISFGIIAYNKKAGVWAWQKDGAGKGGFMTVPKGKDPIPWLGQELRMNPNGETFKTIELAISTHRAELENADGGNS